MFFQAKLKLSNKLKLLLFTTEMKLMLSAKLGTYLFSKNTDNYFSPNCKEVIDKTIL